MIIVSMIFIISHPYIILFCMMHFVQLANIFTVDHSIQYWMSRNIVNWSSLSFYLAVIINLIVIFFYPFRTGNKYIG